MCKWRNIVAPSFDTINCFSSASSHNISLSIPHGPRVVAIALATPRHAARFPSSVWSSMHGCDHTQKLRLATTCSISITHRNSMARYVSIAPDCYNSLLISDLKTSSNMPSNEQSDPADIVLKLQNGNKSSEPGHELQFTYSLWFNRRVQGARTQENYEKNIKKVGTFTTVCCSNAKSV